MVETTVIVAILVADVHTTTVVFIVLTEMRVLCDVTAAAVVNHVVDHVTDTSGVNGEAASAEKQVVFTLVNIVTGVLVVGLVAVRCADSRCIVCVT